MRSRVLRVLLVLLFASAVAWLWVRAAPDAAAAQAPGHWYKGNTHTHTLNSDGDSTPDEVVTWYRSHGYQFLVLTDHNYLTSVDGLNALHGADERFLVIKGEEVTSAVGGLPVHVNGLEVAETVEASTAGTVLGAMQENVDRIRAARGVPSINHPNFGWAISTGDLARLERTRLFEVFNGHPQVNGLGGGGVPGLEETWDRVLSSGRLLYGIAVDDAHTFKQPGNPDVSGPGRGWVYVRAARLEPRAIVDALERGDFYASTGVELEDVAVSPAALTVTVKATRWSKYRIEFIGRNGTVLAESVEPAATYTFTGTEGYVRAKVIESNGRIAWTQPVLVGGAR